MEQRALCLDCLISDLQNSQNTVQSGNETSSSSGGLARGQVSNTELMLGKRSVLHELVDSKDQRSLEKSAVIDQFALRPMIYRDRSGNSGKRGSCFNGRGSQEKNTRGTQTRRESRRFTDRPKPCNLLTSNVCIRDVVRLGLFMHSRNTGATCVQARSALPIHKSITYLLILAYYVLTHAPICISPLNIPSPRRKCSTEPLNSDYSDR